MGLDGGTKITRSDVLRGQSWRLTNADTSRSTRGGSIPTAELLKEQQLEKSLHREIKWTTCALSEQSLEPPIVADFLGNLYNKSAVWTFLLNKNGVFEDESAKHCYRNLIRTNPTRFRHLKHRRDLFEIQTRMENDTFRCPASQLDCRSVPFSAISTCGHLFSDRAIQLMTDQKCMVCSKSFSPVEVVPINSENQTKVEQLRKRLRSGKEMKRTNKKKKIEGPHLT